MEYENILINHEVKYNEVDTRELALELLMKVQAKIADITSQIDFWHLADRKERSAEWLVTAKAARSYAYRDKTLIEFRIRELKNKQKEINLEAQRFYKLEKDKQMTTIDNNNLYSTLRDLYNKNLTPMEAFEKIQGMPKTEMKATDTEDVPTPAEITEAVAEEKVEASTAVESAAQPSNTEENKTARKTKSRG